MKKLQDFHFLKSRYERPGQKKICGWAAHGHACQMGPDADGNCQGHYECIPSRKDDRWHCTRSADNGGKCENGPKPDGTCCQRIPPCVPQDSLRARRGQTSYWLSAFAVPLLLALFSGPWWAGFFDPGQLSQAHQLADLDCAGCHQDDRDLLTRALAYNAPQHANAGCVDCHAIDAHSDSPHNLSPARLDQVRSTRLKQLADTGTAPADVAEPLSLGCHSCHREHRGSAADLKAMTSAQCESCHVARHPDFAAQHPPFGDDYPFKRNTRLVFDHARHENKHFRKASLADQAPAGCSSCHAPAADKRDMGVVDFKESCAGCHGKDVTGERLSDKTIALLGLPALDLASLQAGGIAIGDWPANMEDQEMPAVTRLLLSSDRTLADLLARLADSDNPLYLNDLSEADPATLSAVGRLAWRLKSTLAALREDPADHGPFSAALGSALETTEPDALLHRLPPAMLRQAVDAWFPALQAELASHQAGRAPATRSSPQPALSLADETPPGQWERRPYTLAYRPAGHADPLMHAWLYVSARAYQASAAAAVFEQLAYPKISGQCAKCHAIEQHGSDVHINWQPAGNGERHAGLQRFVHGPHLDDNKPDACADCHTAASGANSLKGFEDRDPLTFSSDFSPLKKSDCAECHGKDDEAPTQCLTCHQYHAVPFATRERGDEG